MERGALPVAINVKPVSPEEKENTVFNILASVK